jgi:hypothetical protein
MSEELYRSDEFEEWFNSCDFVKDNLYGNQQELMYPLLVAWSRGYDDGFKQGVKLFKRKIFRAEPWR